MLSSEQKEVDMPFSGAQFRSLIEVKHVPRSEFSLGPWKTKTGAELEVLFALPHAVVEAFSEYDSDELALLPMDIRGLRCYQNVGNRKNAMGGREFHRVRVELVFCTAGKFLWEVEDLSGAKDVLELSPSLPGVLMPPFILHTHTSLDGGSALLVLANTLFDPEDPLTHDTYSTEMFRKLQEEF